MNKWTRWRLNRRGRVPSDKMIEEAVNWTGPHLRSILDGQMKTYLTVLRDLAMVVSDHPDLGVSE